MAFLVVTSRCIFLAFDKKISVHIYVIDFLHCCHNMAITQYYLALKKTTCQVITIN